MTQKKSSLLASSFSLHMHKTILMTFQILCNYTSHAFNNSSILIDRINNMENGRSSKVIGPLLSYRADIDFGNGRIDLGGLEVYQALYFKKIWETHNGGPKGLGATFYEPTSIPSGFSLIGHYCKPNSIAMFASVLTAKDNTGDPSHGALKNPTDYILIWTSKGLNVSQHEDGYIWLPVSPDGYKPMGHIVTTSPEKPSLDKVKCVRSDFTDLTKVDKWIWGHKMDGSSSMVNLHATKPKTVELSVPTGLFLARNGSNTHELACLKMANNDPYTAMPNFDQIIALIDAYAPLVYFHPDEQYFPSPVFWFFQNGVELYQAGQIPSSVNYDGSNLPSDGGVDDAFLDLPSGEEDKERVKKGFLPIALNYVHVKPALGGTCTDLAMWLFYPFNGGGKFQLGPFTINLGKIGEHVGDWEHITLRINNFHGNLMEVYLSQHAKGKWLTPNEFELINGTRPVVYASLHGHSHYSTPISHVHLTGKLNLSDVRMLHDEFQKMNISSKSWENFFGFGVRDDAAKSNNVMDLASTRSLIWIDYMDFGMEPWLNYTGRWGPKITYDLIAEIVEITHSLPDIVKKLVMKLLEMLPAELIGQEGPQGPMMKESWSGDERV